MPHLQTVDAVRDLMRSIPYHVRSDAAALRYVPDACGMRHCGGLVLPNAPRNRSPYSPMAQKEADAQARGAQFEAEVARILAAMGYEVRCHAAVAGQEVDVLATRSIPGAGTYALMVECKWKGGRTRAGNADVQSIAGAFHLARQANLVTACTLVTNNGFSLDAQEAARSAGIRLATRDALLAELLDVGPYLRELRRSYEVDFGAGDASWYIDPQGSHTTGSLASLDAFVDGWLVAPERQPLILLGGYGTGKTSFCRHYAARLVADGGPVTPLVIPLREFHRAGGLEMLIVQVLAERGGIPGADYDTVRRMHREGLLLMILDGFDEMDSNAVDAASIDARLAELERLTETGPNVILTCRPEFFVSAQEERNALDPVRDLLSARRARFDRVELALWSPDQVDRFVERRTRGMRPPIDREPAFYVDRIRRLPELQDISSRAVHLELVLRLLPTLVEADIPITRPNLYRTFFQRELRREVVENRRLRSISDDMRLDLLRQVTAAAFLDGTARIEFATAAAAIRDALHLPPPEVEPVTRDFLNRSFLRREDDTYHFGHRSFSEYLLATVLRDRLRAGDTSFLRQAEVSDATAGMVLEMLGGPDAFGDLLRMLGLGAEVVPENVPAVLFAGRSIVEHLTSMLSAVSDRPDLRTDVRRFLRGMLDEIFDKLSSVHLYADMYLQQPQDFFDELQLAWQELLDRYDLLERFRFNRYTAGVRLQLRLSEVRLEALVRSAIGGIGGPLASVEGGCPPIYTDEALVLRVFENVWAGLTRAAGENGGTVAVKLVDEPASAQVRVCFVNTGPPIPPEVLEETFQFVRLNDHDIQSWFRSDRSSGGAWVVNQLAPLLGSSIALVSVPECTVFEITLPYRAPEAGADADGSAS